MIAIGSTHQIKHGYFGSLGNSGGKFLLVVSFSNFEDGRVPVLQALDAVPGFGDPTLPRRDRTRAGDLRVRIGGQLGLLAASAGAGRRWAEIAKMNSKTDACHAAV